MHLIDFVLGFCESCERDCIVCCDFIMHCFCTLTSVRLLHITNISVVCDAETSMCVSIVPASNVCQECDPPTRTCHHPPIHPLRLTPSKAPHLSLYLPLILSLPLFFSLSSWLLCFQKVHRVTDDTASHCLLLVKRSHVFSRGRLAPRAEGKTFIPREWLMLMKAEVDPEQQLLFRLNHLDVSQATHLVKGVHGNLFSFCSFCKRYLGILPECSS